MEGHPVGRGSVIARGSKLDDTVEAEADQGDALGTSLRPDGDHCLDQVVDHGGDDQPEPDPGPVTDRHGSYGCFLSRCLHYATHGRCRPSPLLDTALDRNNIV